MLQLVRHLARYGAITIEARHKQWRVGCLVKLPADAMTGYVSTYGDNLYSTLQKLIPLAHEEHKRLWVEFRKPKQQSFNYGTGENGESHP